MPVAGEPGPGPAEEAYDAPARARPFVPALIVDLGFGCGLIAQEIVEVTSLVRLGDMLAEHRPVAAQVARRRLCPGRASALQHRVSVIAPGWSET